MGTLDGVREVFRKEVARHRMGRDAQRNRCKACSRKLRYRAAGLPWHDKGQWTGPKYLREPSRDRIKPAELAGCDNVIDMRDQRIEGWPALGIVQASDGPGVRGVGAQSVDGLGRERDQAARHEATDCLGHGLCGHRHDAR